MASVRSSSYTHVAKGVFGTVPVFLVPVLTSYRTYRSVRYRYWRCTELTKVSGTGTKVCTGTPGIGTDVVPNLPKFPVPVLMSNRTYRSFRGAGNDIVPDLPKFPVPVLMSYPTYRSVRYRCRYQHTLEYIYRQYRRYIPPARYGRTLTHRYMNWT